MVFQCAFDPAAALPRLPMPPFPEQKLFFYPHDPVKAAYPDSGFELTLPAATLVGPQPERVVVTPGADHVVIKVGFRTGGLHRLTGIPMTECYRVAAFDASDLFGNEMKQLNETLRNCTDPEMMVRSIERFLLQQVPKIPQDSRMQAAFEQLESSKGLARMEALAAAACLSLRQFERRFKEQIGLSPKYYARQLRFAHAWNLHQQKPDLSWTAITYHCGYADQMHLVRDFREFAGMNPTHAASTLKTLPFLAAVAD